MRIFLSTSFSGKVDYDTNKVVPEFREYIEAILKALRDAGHEVFCAIEHEDWIISDVPPEVGVEKDLEEIDVADILLALVHDKPSAGVQFEIGFAVAKNKRVIIAKDTEEPLSYFNQGVVNGNFAQFVQFNTPKNLAAQLLAESASR